MSLWLPPSAHEYLGTNLTVTDRDGTSVVSAGTAHVKGAWASLIDPLPEDVYGIYVKVGGLSASATVTSSLLDLGAGPTGGGTEYVVLEDLDCWGATTVLASAGGKHWYFPVFIPAGERLSARHQSVIINKTVNVAVRIYGKAHGWAMDVPVKWERLGAVTNSNGVSVTPGSGAFGAWTTILDPITKNYRWWHVGHDGLADTTLTAQSKLIEVGIGPDASNVSTIGQWGFSSTAGEEISGPFPQTPVFQPLLDDAANGVFARIAGGGTEARGVLVYAGE